MKKICTTLLLLLTGTALRAQFGPGTIVKDFKKMEGAWTGTLTYLDYTSGEPYTMPAGLEVALIGKSRAFEFTNLYPDEPQANDKDTILISAEGDFIDGERVISRKRLSGGRIEIITEESGVDGNDQKPAVFRHTYLLSKQAFTMRKDVQFTGENAWIKRHEYSFARK